MQRRGLRHRAVVRRLQHSLGRQNVRQRRLVRIDSRPRQGQGVLRRLQVVAQRLDLLLCLGFACQRQGLGTVPFRLQRGQTFAQGRNVGCGPFSRYLRIQRC